MCHNNLNRTLVLLRNRLALDAGLDLSINKVLDEIPNLLLGKFLCLIKGELLVLDGLLDGKGWPFVDLEIQITSVGSEGFCINNS